MRQLYMVLGCLAYPAWLQAVEFRLGYQKRLLLQQSYAGGERGLQKEGGKRGQGVVSRLQKHQLQDLLCSLDAQACAARTAVYTAYCTVADTQQCGWHTACELQTPKPTFLSSMAEVIATVEISFPVFIRA